MENSQDAIGAHSENVTGLLLALSELLDAGVPAWQAFAQAHIAVGRNVLEAFRIMGAVDEIRVSRWFEGLASGDCVEAIRRGERDGFVTEGLRAAAARAAASQPE